MTAPQRYSSRLAYEARVQRIWAAGNDAPHGVRTFGRRMLVPAMRNGAMRNLQIIEPDGSTRFLTPGKTRGCCHLIGRPVTFVLVAAEYSTASRLHDLTGQAIAVCFDLDNMPHVIRKMWCEFAVPVIAVTTDFDERIEISARSFDGFSVATDLKPWGPA